MASIRRAALKRPGIDRPETFTQFLSKVFRERRLQKNITMRAVATNSGMSASFICDFENTVRGISCESWAVLCGAIGLDPAKAFERAFREFQDAVFYGGLTPSAAAPPRASG